MDVNSSREWWAQGRSTTSSRSSAVWRAWLSHCSWANLGIKIGHTLGLYAGSMTSTATLQAALDVMKNKSLDRRLYAYPFGVIGPILCIYFMTRIVKPKFPAKTQRFHMERFRLANASPVDAWAI